MEDLSVEFFDPEHGPVHAVRGVALELRRGETLGIVGESGCGKSVLMMSVLGLVPRLGGRVTGGRAFFEGTNMLALSPRELRQILGARIGMVFQDSMTSLNPVLSIGRQLTETMRHHLGLSRAASRARAVELLDLVRIPGGERRLDDYPHELSGGMRQRVMIAIALSCQPSLLIADEPTTSLDVTMQAQILELIGSFRREMNMSVILVSHDLGVVAGLADRVGVMYAGKIVEYGEARDVFHHTQHPYTAGLLRSGLRIDGKRQEHLSVIPGTLPDPFDEAVGCTFSARCSHALGVCRESTPELKDAEHSTRSHAAACWLSAEQRATLLVGARC